MVITFYALRPFNFMMGFAWHEDEQELDLFIVLGCN